MMARSGLGRFAAVGPPTRNKTDTPVSPGVTFFVVAYCAGEICKPRSGVKSSLQPHL